MEPTYNCSSRFRIAHPRHEANAAHGVEQLRFAFRFHLFAQVAHVDVEGVGISNEGGTPDGIQNRLALLHGVRVFYKEQQQLKFPLRKCNVAFSSLDASLDRIQQ